MVFVNFIKLAKHTSSGERIQFFLSSHAYLHGNSLINYRDLFSRKWSKDGPHPSNTTKNYLGIDNGHYGLYYTMYNHDADRKNGQAIGYSMETLYTFILSGGDISIGLMVLDYDGKFFISRTNRDIHNSMKMSRGLGSLRYYLTKRETEQVEPISKIEELDETYNDGELEKIKPVETASQLETVPLETVQIESVPLNTVLNIVPLEAKPQTVQIVIAPVETSQFAAVQSEPLNSQSPTEPVQTEDVQSAFTSSLLNTSLSTILETYQNHSSADQLNSIYPIYQSLKRNDIPLPDIESYNIILHSIAERLLDSEFEATELKLTNLLTIYQDILQNGTKPSNETYNIILSSLFEGSLQDLSRNNPFSFHSGKPKEFGQIGLDIFSSILHYDKLNSELIHQILKFVNKYPTYISQTLLDRLIPLIEFTDQTAEYYYSVIEFTSHFHKFNIFENDAARIYEFINKVYSNFKETSPQVDEYVMYCKLIEGLIHNNQFSLASKFLDEILIEYRGSLELTSKATNSQISSVISLYISAILEQDLKKAYGLLVKFNKITYIPELSNSLFNQIIVGYIGQYREGTDMSELTEIYDRIWYLYNYMAIRKDYNEFVSADGKPHCRDLLISLSIDLGDHSHVFQLIKEVLLRNHLIFDLASFQKLLNYLHNGVLYNNSGVEPFNQYYFGLIWSIIASQLTHYTSNSKDLNAFISQYINYLQLPVNGSELNEYSIRLFMNSSMVEKAVDSFDFHADNIYGLISISKTLMLFKSEDSELLNKVLKFQSRLINVFEDTENQYVELTGDLIAYKTSVKLHFKSLASRLSVIDLDIADTCKILNMPVPNTIHVKVNYDTNLTYLLNVNYDAGVSEFVELFRNGSTFTSETWNIIINYKFAKTYFDSNNKTEIKCSEFIQRLWSLNFDEELKVTLLKQLLQLHNDIVAIKVVGFLKLNQNVFLSLLPELINEAEATSNNYLKNLVGEAAFFDAAYKSSESKNWLEKYFKFLNKERRFEDTIAFVERYQIPLSKQILFFYMTAALASNSKDKFIAAFKANSPSSDELRSSPEFVELSISYYFSLESLASVETILSRFSTFKDCSQNIRELLLYASLLSTKSSIKKFSRPRTINELSLILLNQDSLNEKLKLLNNSRLITNMSAKFQLIDNLIFNLIKLSSSKLLKDVTRKLQSTLRFFKLADFRHLNVGQLSSIIKLLTLNNSRDTLNTLLTKLINNRNYTDVLNFYFMETRLFGIQDKTKVLELLLKSFNYLKDKINVFAITKYCQEHRIVLTQYNEELFKKELLP